MKAKKQPGPARRCPSRPRGAARRRAVLQSARPKGRPRPPRSFEISEGCFPRRPRPGQPGSALLRKVGNSERCAQEARGCAQGAVYNTHKITLKPGKLRVCFKKSTGVGGGGKQGGRGTYYLFTVIYTYTYTYTHTHTHTHTHPISYLPRYLCK